MRHLNRSYKTGLASFFLLVILLISSRVQADSDSQLSLKQVAESAHWQRLLHRYQRAESSIDDPRFFLAGRDASALDELIATLRQMTSSRPVDNDHPRCRYPARYRWLREQRLLSTPSISDQGCSDYRQWREQVNAHSVSLIFPSAYLNSPSSMYGHTFLRFDPVDAEQGSLWLSWALNFGANITVDDNSLLYAYKGLFGGYPGQFNMMPYFEKIKEYNRMENRDIWEYRLKLAPDEVERLLEHIWELKEVNFDYFFFDENCSYRLLELIDLVRPEAKLIEGFDLFAIPVDTVRAVMSAGLVESSSFRPSHRQRFYRQLESVGTEQLPLVVELSDRISESGRQQLEQLPEQQQQPTVQAAYQYLRLREDGRQRDPQASRTSHQLLKWISELPAVEPLSPPLQFEPSGGHRSSTAAIGLGDDQRGSHLQLHYRFAYHDLLDPPMGYPEGSQLEMFAAELRFYDDGARLQRLDLVAIRSLIPRDRWFEPISWQVRGGLEQVQSAPAAGDHLAAHVTGGGGISYGLDPAQRWIGFALLTGRLELNSELADDGAVGLGISSGIRSGGLVWQGVLELEHSKLSTGFSRTALGLSGQYNLADNRGWRLKLQQRWLDGDDSDLYGALEYRVYH